MQTNVTLTDYRVRYFLCSSNLKTVTVRYIPRKQDNLILNSKTNITNLIK